MDYKQQIDEILSRLTDNFQYFDLKIYFSEVFHNKSGFDIIIANPPYIKEYINRSAFDGLRDSPYYQGKMDIWYMFACKGIDFLKPYGIITLIAQNNWVTSFGAKKMRKKIIEDAKILQMVDFYTFKIFESSEIQTMIMIFQKNSKDDNYQFDFRRVKVENPDYKDIIDMLNKLPNEKIVYLLPCFNRKILKDKPFTFNEDIIEVLLRKILHQSNFNLLDNEITNGIHTHHDYVTKEMLKILGPNFKVGDGIFVLSEVEKNSIPFTPTELELIKPYYTSEELKKYYAVKKNSKWIIYTDSKFRNPKFIEPYPNIKKHLDKFQQVITSDNKPYGLHRARDEKFFKGEKIIALRKCVEPCFTYTDFDCYVSAAFYIIKTERVNMKFLTALLNSKVVKFWLRYKGKMQGSNYQIDKEPLLNLPLKIPKNVQPFVNLVEEIIARIKQNPAANISELEIQIDKLVYELYDLTNEEIEIIEKIR
nr:N-6 DNA methylase [Caldicellulosiruptor hydrothermalis]